MRTGATTCILLLGLAIGSCDGREATGPIVERASFILSASPKKTKGFTKADYKKHVAELRKMAPEGFSIVVEKPFVVVGDEPAKVVEKRARNTVKWTVDRLKRDFFTKDPKHIIDIWLFKDEASYTTNAKKLFGHDPTTPYGYYSETDRALVMNISTGGGTLVHEIVHPFMETNFPQCPAWFNEGLGSLYEQCTDSDGHIWGLPNWRLPGLQEAIASDLVPSFETLTAQTESAFYNEDPGTNYSQSRYLCLYLQENGLLVDYYHAFRKAHEDDPTGYETLERTLGVDDMGAFKKEWEGWVLGLSFP
jgi:hypothetical protein